MMEVDAALCRTEWLRAMQKFGTRIVGTKPAREILYTREEGYEYAIKSKL